MPHDNHYWDGIRTNQSMWVHLGAWMQVRSVCMTLWIQFYRDLLGSGRVDADVNDFSEAVFKCKLPCDKL